MTAVQERQIERNQRMAAAGEEGKTNKADGESSDDWEDVDVSDGEMEQVEEVASEEEEGSSEPSSNFSNNREESKSTGFTIITTGNDGGQPSSSSFSLIDS